MSQDSPQIQEIKARYKSSFPEKATLLNGLLATVNTGGDLNTLRQELHKLAGSSGMYSYDEIAGLCRKAMQSLDADQIDDLQAQLTQLVELIEQQV